MENNEKEKQETEFLETINSFIKYMIKEYDKPKKGRSLLVIASDEMKSCVSFIGNRIDGCVSVTNAMLSDEDIDRILEISNSSVNDINAANDINNVNNEPLKSVIKGIDKDFYDFIRGLKRGDKKDE